MGVVWFCSISQQFRLVWTAPRAPAFRPCFCELADVMSVLLMRVVTAHRTNNKLELAHEPPFRTFRFARLKAGACVMLRRTLPSCSDPSPRLFSCSPASTGVHFTEAC
eukprot:5790456-Pleurochrysis_carterae.AAC.2